MRCGMPGGGPETAIMQNRQGYCSCCNIPYSSPEEHLQSTQHRQYINSTRYSVTNRCLLSRFLQDVLQYHPFQYDDSRPSYIDLPPVGIPLIPKAEFSNVTQVFDEEEDEESVGTREHLPSSDTGKTEKVPSSDSESCKILDSGGASFSQGDSFSTKGSSLLQKQNSVHRKLSAEGSANQPKVAQSSVKSSLPKQSVSDKTTSSHISPGVPESTSNLSLPKFPTFAQFSTSCKVPTSACNSDCKLEKLSNRTPYMCHICTLGTARSKTSSASHRRPAVILGSALNVSSGTYFTKYCSLEPQDITTESPSYLRDPEKNSDLFGARKFQAGIKRKSILKRKLQDCKNVTGSDAAEDSFTDIIEEVIQKYCYGTAQDQSSCTDKGSFHMSISPTVDCASSQSSSICFEWDKLIQRENGPCKNEAELGHLREVSVSFEDKQYEPQLHTFLKRFCDESVVLHLYPRPSDERLCVPPLPHVPPSFVGKTWSQIIREDDLKVEQLVREFREERFRCYFDSESVAKCRKRKCKIEKKKKESEMRCLHTAFEDKPQELPLQDSDSDYSYHPFPSDMPPKPVRHKLKGKTQHLVSRCQIVKVSHGTQTSVVNYPVVKRKFARKDYESATPPTKVSILEHEETAEMKTRLCALKLPDSYSKIMNPLQPKAVVYVLSTPENAQISANVGRISRKKKNSQSLDCKGSIKYKYRMCPVKYYDPLTNKIMKAPPRGLLVSKSKSPHVRKLFRSLSPDINMEKQRESLNSLSVCESDPCTASSVSPSSEALKMKIGDCSASQKAFAPSKNDCLVSLKQPPFSSDKSENSYKQYVMSSLNLPSQTKGAMTLSPLIPKVSRVARKQFLTKKNPENNKGRLKQKPSCTVKSLRMPLTGPSRRCEKGQRTLEKEMPRKNKQKEMPGKNKQNEMPRKNKQKEMPRKNVLYTNKTSSRRPCPKQKVGGEGKIKFVEKQVINTRANRTHLQRIPSDCIEGGQLMSACSQTEKTSKIKKKCDRVCHSVQRSSARSKHACFIKDMSFQGSGPKGSLRKSKLTESKETKAKEKKAGTYHRPRQK